jgi:predicted transposase YbfD/YdcC
LALKKNNKLIYEQVSSRLKQVKAELAYNKDVDFGSGRTEKRTCYVENNLELYDDLRPWEHLRSIVMVEAEREIKGKISCETRYYLCNLGLEASEFNKLIRDYWSIENKLQWKLDVVFNEDAQRTKTGNVPQNLAIIRKFALQLINQIEDKESIKNRRME